MEDRIFYSSLKLGNCDIEIFNFCHHQVQNFQIFNQYEWMSKTFEIIKSKVKVNKIQQNGTKSNVYTLKFCQTSWNFVKFFSVLLNTVKDSLAMQKTERFGHTVFKNFIKNVLLEEKGAFEHKWTLDFILVTFAQAKWTKSKPTFVQTFNKVWW